MQGRGAGAIGRRETMLDVIMDQLALGVGEGVLDRVQLLGEVESRPALLEHRQNLAEMAVGALEALDDFGVAGVFHDIPRAIRRRADPRAPVRRSYPIGEDRINPVAVAAAPDSSARRAPAPRRFAFAERPFDVIMDGVKVLPLLRPKQHFAGLGANAIRPSFRHATPQTPEIRRCPRSK